MMFESRCRVSSAEKPESDAHAAGSVPESELFDRINSLRLGQPQSTLKVPVAHSRDSEPL